MDKDWENQFDELVKGLDLTPNITPEDLTPNDMHRAVLGMSETSMWIGKHLMDSLGNEDEACSELDEDVTLLVRELLNITAALSDLLSICYCPECEGGLCPDCTMEEMCEDCFDLLERMEDDDDD